MGRTEKWSTWLSTSSASQHAAREPADWPNSASTSGTMPSVGEVTNTGGVESGTQPSVSYSASRSTVFSALMRTHTWCPPASGECAAGTARRMVTGNTGGTSRRSSSTSWNWSSAAVVISDTVTDATLVCWSTSVNRQPQCVMLALKSASAKSLSDTMSMAKLSVGGLESWTWPSVVAHTLAPAALRENNTP